VIHLNDCNVPIAEAQAARFSVRYGVNRRQKKTHRESELRGRVTDLRVLSILVSARRTGWDVDHRQ
jgi:hypothetical protein